MKTLAFSALTLALTLSACNNPTTVKTTTFSTTLSGSNEVPPLVGVAASGTAKLEVNESTKEATLTGSVSNLSGDLTMAHIHGPALAGVNGPVVFPLTLTNDTVYKSATLSGKFTLTDAQMADLKGKKFYVNVHTAANPMGEARGQIE